MASLEKISVFLKLNESKKNSIRKAILRLANEWKDLDEHLDSAQNSFQVCFDELDSRQKNLSSIQESVTESNKELQSIRESLEQRSKELEAKEKELNAFIIEQIEDSKRKEKQISSLQSSVAVKMDELRLREEKLLETQKIVEGIFENLKLKQKQFESLQESIDERLKEVNVKVMHLKDKSKELGLVQNWIERRVKELDAKEEQYEERVKELGLKENIFELMQKLTEEKSNELELKEKKIEEQAKELDLRDRELQLKEQKIEEQAAELGLRNKEHDSTIVEYLTEMQTKKNQLQLEQNLLQERLKKLGMKEKEIDERRKELELKEKQFSNVIGPKIKAEPIDNMPADNAMNRPYDLQFNVTMDGKSLQILLNGREKDHASMSDEVYGALILSSDPAKLVLDAMEGFYPPHLKKDGMEFAGSVVRGSCILLLQQLMRISPVIRPHVREEALKLAGDWKVKMGAVVKNSLEASGFLHLLESYGLAYAYSMNELQKVFEIAVEHMQISQLRLPGFKDKIPDLVQSLIERKKHLLAVKFICAFDLVHKFPPRNILQSYLMYVRKIANAMSRKGSNKLKAKNIAIDHRIDAMRSLINFVIEHKLDSLYPPSLLEQRIEQLTVNKKNIGSAPLPPTKTQKQQNGETTKDKASVRTSDCAKDLSMALVPVKASSGILGTVNGMAVALANMDGKNLLFFLTENLQEHEWLCNDIYAALQISFDSEKLVLDAIQGFYPPHSKQGCIDPEASVIRRSCILLLEQLMRLSPNINTQVKTEAIKLALDWKAKMRAENENPLVVLGFLQLVGTFGLFSCFGKVELLNLYETVSQYRHAPALCHALGFSEKIPVSSIHQSDLTVQQSSSEKLPSQKGEHDSVCNEIPNFIRCASDPAKLALDALQCCHNSKLKEPETMKLGFFESCVHLLNHLVGVGPGIHPLVKEKAMKFAIEWKVKLGESGLNCTEVLGFLHLLAIYKLASSFDADELLALLGIVHERVSTKLFLALGLVGKIPGFVRNLVLKEQCLEAIRYIYAFELDKMFPPVPLLVNHLSYSEKAAAKICDDGHNSVEAQKKANKVELTALRQVLACVLHHGLESELTPAALRSQISKLETQIQKIPSKTANTKLKHHGAPKNSFSVPSAQPLTKKRPFTSSKAQLKNQKKKHCQPYIQQSKSHANVERAPAFAAPSTVAPPECPQGEFFYEEGGDHSAGPAQQYGLGPASTFGRPHMGHPSGWQYRFGQSHHGMGLSTCAAQLPFFPAKHCTYNSHGTRPKPFNL